MDYQANESHSNDKKWDKVDIEFTFHEDVIYGVKLNNEANIAAVNRYKLILSRFIVWLHSLSE